MIGKIKVHIGTIKSRDDVALVTDKDTPQQKVVWLSPEEALFTAGLLVKYVQKLALRKGKEHANIVEFPKMKSRPHGRKFDA